MHRKELNERSPLRVLDQSIHGGLGRGNLGVVVARHGVGKTAFLVGVALDDLMRGRKVLHVAVGEPMEKVEAYYDEIFIDLAHEQRLEDQWAARMDAERNRRIQCYTGYDFSLDKLRETLSFWKKVNDFLPAAIVIEGFDFAAASAEQLAELREIARSADAEVWMSATTTRDAERNDQGQVGVLHGQFSPANPAQKSRLQTKFAASSELPRPRYLATSGYRQSGRDRVTSPL